MRGEERESWALHSDSENVSLQFCVLEGCVGMSPGGLESFSNGREWVRTEI